MSGYAFGHHEIMLELVRSTEPQCIGGSGFGTDVNASQLCRDLIARLRYVSCTLQHRLRNSTPDQHCTNALNYLQRAFLNLPPGSTSRNFTS